jgi:hypothetical protein
MPVINIHTSKNDDNSDVITITVDKTTIITVITSGVKTISVTENPKVVQPETGIRPVPVVNHLMGNPCRNY